MRFWNVLAILAAGGLLFGPGPAVAEEAEKVDFTQQIKPILERSCLKCHSAERDQGGLRLHTREATLEGGDSGASVVPGQPEESELYERIILPEDDPIHMPAEGKALTQEETDLIRDWIAQGAEWADELVLQPARPADPGQQVPEFALEPLTDEELAVMAEIRGMGGHVMQLAQNDFRLEVAWHLADGEITDEYLEPLTRLPRVVHLNLRGTAVTDEGLAMLRGCANLTRLHLERTGITDAALEHLKELPALQFLNIYGTGVTDAAVDQLAQFPSLQKVFIWETKITIDGVQKLKEARPDLEIIPDLVVEKQKAEEEAKRKAEEEEEARKKAEEEEAKKKAEEEAKKKEEEAKEEDDAEAEEEEAQEDEADEAEADNEEPENAEQEDSEA